MYVADWVTLDSLHDERNIEASAFTWATEELDGDLSATTNGAVVFRRVDGETDRYENRSFGWYQLLHRTLEDEEYERFERYYRALSAEWQDGSNEYRLATERLCNQLGRVETEDAIRTVPRVIAVLATTARFVMHEYSPPARLAGAAIVFHLHFAEGVPLANAETTVNQALPDGQTVDDVVEDINQVIDTGEIETVINPEHQQ